MLDNIKFLAWQDYAGLNLNQKVKPNKKRKMKRQILFRGWSELHNRWVEGNFTYDAIGQPRIIKVESSGQGLTFIPVHPDSVGQFTGLCDMDGNKAFEGDIGENQDGAEFIITYVMMGFEMRKPDGNRFEGNTVWFHKFKITGNTFNP
jgi:hypothetical protein